jgi:FMN phosphatase YigB (HAD superfamily)
MEFLTDRKRHLICLPYSLENLHKMAKQLGIKRCWFHRNHYDIPKLRIEEIESKCTIISSKEIVKIINENKFV